MYYLLEASPQGQLQSSSPGDALRGLPDLLRDMCKTTTYFDGRLRLSISARSGANSIDYAIVGSKLIVLVGYARSFGVDGFLTPVMILDLIENGTRRFGGQYTVLIYDDEIREVEVLTTIARLIPAYWAREYGTLLVSNRMMGVRSRLETVTLDRAALSPFLSQGYLPHERSYVKEVGLCPADSSSRWRIRAGDEYFGCHSLSSVLDSVGTIPPTDSLFDELATALQRSFVPIVSNASIRIGLTGGRDSRLIAAALSTAGANFTTYTRAEDPREIEVQVAERVARELRLEHQTRLDQGIITERDTEVPGRSELLKRIQKVGKNSDFAVFAHDSLVASPTKFNDDAIAYNGGGGELMRQAYGDGAWQSPEQAMRRIRRHADGLRWGTPDREYKDWLEAWIESNKSLEPGALLNKFSVLYRTGRWGSGVYASTYGAVNQRPFYDNELLSLVLPIDTRWSATDVLYFESMKRLAPRVLNIPFAGNRDWLLSKAPTSVYHDIGEDLPRSIRVDSSETAARSPLGWRQQVAGPLGDELLQIATDLGSGFDLFDLNAIARLREAKSAMKPGVKNGALAKRIWAMASAGVYVNQIN